MTQQEQKMGIQNFPKVELDFSPQIPKMNKIEDKTKIDVRYCLISPFAFAHVYWDPKIYEVVYELEEPLLNRKEEEYRKSVLQAMREMINFDIVVEKDLQGLLDYIDQRFKFLAIELGIEMNYESYKKIYYYLCRDFIGFNEIEPLLRDYFIEDIENNGTDTPVYIVHRLYRNMKTNVIFKDNDKLEGFVEKLAQRTGQYISYANPILDGSLPDGSRVNATYTKDITSRGPTFCFKEGKVQLSDGRVKDVKELFEECKKNYGSSIEDGNEVVKISNVHCCGVDEKNLGQKDSTMKSIIKIKAPDNLVKIKFEDGGETEVTLDHKFHIVGESLETLEAKNLKKGMIVPMPKKIVVIGYRQKINAYQMIKDFSYHKKICLISTPAIKKIISQEINSYPPDRYRTIMSNKYGMGNSYFYEIINRGSSVSFSVLDQVCTNQGFDLSEMEDLQINVYGGGTKDKSKAIKLPREVNEDLAYIAGVLISDGHISPNSIDFSCYEKGVKNSVKEKLIRLFGKFESYYNDNRIYLCNSFAPYFFNKVFGVPSGKKSHTVEIPEIILKSEDEVIASFIKGLFDGDGTASSGLSYKTYSKNLAEGLTYALARLGIFSYLRTGEKEYRVNIPSPYYELYDDKIGFDSLNKKMLLKSMIEKQAGNDRKKFIRHDRVPGMPVLSIIKKLGIANREILKNCGINFNRFYYTTFSKTFVHKLMQEIEKNKNSPLVKKEMDYLKWMLNSEQEFVRIEEVEIIGNSEPVYDIELEPCKFFVAGNKPMNMFDTIRKFTKEPWTPPQLISFNTLSPEMIAYLWLLVQYKMNILITGGTSSGKTTLLNAIAFFIPPEARVVSIEDSVTGDSKIIIKEKGKFRNITIKEFVDNKIDAEVMTLDKKGKVIWAKPSDYIKHRVKKDIYEITTSTGRKIKVTQDHSLFTLGKDNELSEIKPLELKEKESFIAVPRSLPIEGREISHINLMNHLEHFSEDFLEGEPVKKLLEKYDHRKLKIEKERFRWWKNHGVIKIKNFLELNDKFTDRELDGLKIKSKNTSSIPVIFRVSKEFLEFCGLWLGDGSYDNYNGNSVIISNIDDECREIFIKIADYIGAGYSLMSDGGVSMRLHSTIFYKFMKNVLKFDGYSSTKKIPEFIFNLSNEQINHFIRGYFSADGCMKKNEVSCASQSMELLEDLQTLFLRLEIIARIGDFERKDKCINMSISSFENIDKFKDIGFLQDRKNVLLNSYQLKSHHASSDIIPLSLNKLSELNKITSTKLQYPYMMKWQNIGRNYMQKIAPASSEFNDLSHNDILWDKVKKIRKISSEEIEVFDLSMPEYEKFICNNILVHNTRELNLPRENWLPSVSRTSSGIRGIGTVSLFDLLRSSFRQNPDYVIVGEVRGKETSVLFQGMASGHSSISTIHSDSVESVIRRLETPPIELPPTLLNVLDCVCIMTHAIVNKQETRRLREIVEIIDVSPEGIAVTNTPFVWNPADDGFYFKKNSIVLGKISHRYGLNMHDLEVEFRRRTQLLYELFRRKVFGFKQVQQVINEYYKKPQQVLNQFDIKF